MASQQLPPNPLNYPPSFSSLWYSSSSSKKSLILRYEHISEKAAPYEESLGYTAHIATKNESVPDVAMIISRDIYPSPTMGVFLEQENRVYRWLGLHFHWRGKRKMNMKTCIRSF